MTMATFGPPFRLPPFHGGRIPVPVGETCRWCPETFEAGDQGMAVPCVRLAEGGGDVEYYVGYYHRWCYVRASGGVGSVECQRARGRGEFDCLAHAQGELPQDGTVREHAVAAATYFYGGTLPD